MEDVLREHINFSNFHVVVRTGDTAKPEDLEKVSVKDARTVLVVSPADHTREAAVARTRHVLLTMRSMSGQETERVSRDMLREFKGVGTG